jgi:DNA-binding transcriptional MerR regulator
MDWQLPGTTLSIPRETADNIEERFRAMFCAGGMVLSQVAGVSGVEAYTIQNWVKRGFLTKPEGKRYSQRQLCRILNINVMRSVMSLEQICQLLRYINGTLDDEMDDVIDDSALYFLFVRLALRAKQLDEPERLQQALEDFLVDYQEPVPGARKRVENTLRIMLVAWVASKMQSAAESMLKELN